MVGPDIFWLQSLDNQFSAAQEGAQIVLGVNYNVMQASIGTFKIDAILSLSLIGNRPW